MDDQAAVAQLTTDLQWQIDQVKARGIKAEAGHPYTPSAYKRGLTNAIGRGGLGVVEFVQAQVHNPSSDGIVPLEEADSLDLACESLVVDTDKPYASLFTDEDRTAARGYLSPHVDAVKARKAERRDRVIAVRNEMRAKRGLPPLTDEQLRLTE